MMQLRFENGEVISFHILLSKLTCDYLSVLGLKSIYVERTIIPKIYHEMYALNEMAHALIKPLPKPMLIEFLDAI